MKIFYKYQSLKGESNHSENYTLENLRKNQIYFSHPTDFNDPFDCKLNYIYKGKKELWYPLYKKYNNYTRAQAEKSLREEIDKGRFVKDGYYIIYDPKNDGNRGQYDNLFHGNFQKESLPLVSCFSEKHNDMLMWGHYADKHRGICLCFKSYKPPIDDSDKLPSDIDCSYSLIPLKNYNSSKIPSPQLGICLWRVRYSNVLLNPINMLDSNSYYEIIRGLTTKKSDWEYENEYRMIIAQSLFQQHNLINYNKEDLEGIIFGMNISLSDAKSVYEIVCDEYLDKGADVNFYKVKEILEERKIQIEPISNIDNYFASLA